MTLLYILIAYIAGIGSVLFVEFSIRFAERMEEESPPPETPKEADYPPAVQFVDPIPPEERLKQIDVNKLEL